MTRYESIRAVANDIAQQDETQKKPTRGTSLRAMIRSRLDAGQLQFEGIWRALQAEYPHRHIAWSYVQRIGREWAIEGLEHRSVMNEKPTQPTEREEPPNPPSDINELCGQGRLGAAVIEGWGENPGVHPTVAYSCRGAAKLINALVDAIRGLQEGGSNGRASGDPTTPRTRANLSRHS